MKKILIITPAALLCLSAGITAVFAAGNGNGFGKGNCGGNGCKNRFGK